MTSVKEDLIWGADAIAAELGLDRRRAFYMLEKRMIPAQKVGRAWCASRTGLKTFFSNIAAGKLPESASEER
ncbi:DNA-binding protein [Labrys okinawensis]|uniref:DNA-binding protein n=1 Tax=Labrys okinawensis TaxID=346911 RepID=UPI0039BD7F24